MKQSVLVCQDCDLIFEEIWKAGEHEAACEESGLGGFRVEVYDVR